MMSTNNNINFYNDLKNDTTCKIVLKEIAYILKNSNSHFHDEDILKYICDRYLKSIRNYVTIAKGLSNILQEILRYCIEYNYFTLIKYLIEQIYPQSEKKFFLQYILEIAIDVSNKEVLEYFMTDFVKENIFLKNDNASLKKLIWRIQHKKEFSEEDDNIALSNCKDVYQNKDRSILEFIKTTFSLDFNIINNSPSTCCQMTKISVDNYIQQLINDELNSVMVRELIFAIKSDSLICFKSIHLSNFVLLDHSGSKIMLKNYHGKWYSNLVDVILIYNAVKIGRYILPLLDFTQYSFYKNQLHWNYICLHFARHELMELLTEILLKQHSIKITTSQIKYNYGIEIFEILNSMVSYEKCDDLKKNITTILRYHSKMYQDFLVPYPSIYKLNYTVLHSMLEKKHT